MAHVDASLLSYLIAVPLVGALVVLFAPRQSVGFIRFWSTLITLFEFCLSLRLLHEKFNTSEFRFLVEKPWIESLGIGYTLGVDGVSLWLVLLTTFMTPIALYCSWSSVQTKVKEFALSFLILEAAMLGAFVALDLFLFYIFWELMLVPMYLIVGIWGGKNRVYAAVKFFLYTMVGSLLMLVAILYLALQYKALAGNYSFDIRELYRVVLPHSAQYWLFAAFALSFAIKVPMFPFHTWLPDAHVEAPTGGSVILAAVLLKLGTYGFLRFAMPFFPWAAHHLAPSLAVLAVIGILYGAYCAWVQQDIKKLVAYSSVSHLGFVMLGVFAMNIAGVSGAILQMVSHGVSTGALFILVGVIYERRHTREITEFGGLAKSMPLYAIIFLIVTMSSIGLPGTNGFIGEFLILNGTFISDKLSFPRLSVAFAALGVILAAVYMLHLVQKMFWGPLDVEKNGKLPDLSSRELRLLLPLVAMIFVMGLYPRPMLVRMQPAVDDLVVHYEAKLLHSRGDTAKLIKATQGLVLAPSQNSPSEKSPRIKSSKRLPNKAVAFGPAPSHLMTAAVPSSN